MLENNSEHICTSMKSTESEYHKYIPQINTKVGFFILTNPLWTGSLTLAANAALSWEVSISLYGAVSPGRRAHTILTFTGKSFRMVTTSMWFMPSRRCPFTCAAIMPKHEPPSQHNVVWWSFRVANLTSSYLPYLGTNWLITYKDQ